MLVFAAHTGVTNILFSHRSLLFIYLHSVDLPDKDLVERCNKNEIKDTRNCTNFKCKLSRKVESEAKILK